MPLNTLTSTEDLVHRLQDPGVADSLNRLLDQLPTMVFAVEALNSLVARSDGIVENIAGLVGEVRSVKIPAEAREFGASLPGLVKAGTTLSAAAGTKGFDNLLDPGLLNALGDEQKIALVRRLLDKLELIVFAVEAADGFIRRSDTMVEGLRDVVREAAGFDVDGEMLAQLKSLLGASPQLLKAASHLAESGLLEKAEHVLEAGDRLFESGLLDPSKITMVSDMGATLAQSLDAARAAANQKTPARKIGIFDLLGALKDPDIQASVGFFLEFGKRYGQRLRQANHA